MDNLTREYRQILTARIAARAAQHANAEPYSTRGRGLALTASALLLWEKMSEVSTSLVSVKRWTDTTHTQEDQLVFLVMDGRGLLLDCVWRVRAQDFREFPMNSRYVNTGGERWKLRHSAFRAALKPETSERAVLENWHDMLVELWGEDTIEEAQQSLFRNPPKTRVQLDEIAAGVRAAETVFYQRHPQLR